MLWEVPGKSMLEAGQPALPIWFLLGHLSRLPTQGRLESGQVLP